MSANFLSSIVSVAYFKSLNLEKFIKINELFVVLLAIRPARKSAFVEHILFSSNYSFCFEK
ncbi:hypothetical protein BpHYR1_014463 [Brachionus plicatilis]|uniref:Uncharacterized protein n=1 Tax=Brachionus plicatilis TaxID=10195 RepID=A0A3M7R0T8_BRAPC|nr:hypothetical protein BpHYR1_014463 [Brachionus plicatilis]